MNITDLYNMDCRDAMSLFIPDNSVDAIVTDPPYGLSFMGKKWDHDVPGVDIWTECLRVLKPGGHLLAFAGTRTQHRMAVRIEDAGFEIRDMIAWIYGSGFPKSHNGEWGGTALKPALEPITMARKPLIGTVAANVLAHGTGGLNIDGCRVGDEGGTAKGTFPKGASKGTYGNGLNGGCEILDLGKGRWPANLIHDGSLDVVAAFPQAKGQQGPISGSAARFFYCAKASRADRNEGLPIGGKPAVSSGGTMGDCQRADWVERNGNHHPTVKPTDLMAYLCRLVTPPGGVVFDPFMGSGSTGKAALREGFGFIGCEMDEAYFNIAQARIDAVKAEQKDSPT